MPDTVLSLTTTINLETLLAHIPALPVREEVLRDVRFALMGEWYERNAPYTIVPVTNGEHLVFHEHHLVRRLSMIKPESQRIFIEAVHRRLPKVGEAIEIEVEWSRSAKRIIMITRLEIRGDLSFRLKP